MDLPNTSRPPRDSLATADHAAAAVPPEAPAYRAALAAYDGSRLDAIAQAIGLDVPPRARSATIASLIADRLGETKVTERLIAGLGHGPRLTLGLFAFTESPSWPARGLEHTLACLGVDARSAALELLGLGLLALHVTPFGTIRGFEAAFSDAPEEVARFTLCAHPGAVSAARTVLPEGEGPTACGPVRLAREADGLEPILRLAAIWQRVADAPMRQTQQGTFYKRDRERLEDDAVVAGPIADAIEPLPDMPALWLTLGRAVGLLQAEPGSERVTAAKPAYWTENAFHLPQMVATQWLALRTWHEQGGMQNEGAEATLALPFVRPALLLWLATVGEGDWVATDDFAAFLRVRFPNWDRPALQEPPTPLALPSPRGKGLKGGRAKGTARATEPGDLDVLEAVLLGAGYQLGLIRAAEEVPSGRRAVQLTPLGRYLLSIGPPPPPRPEFPHFLFVQPNFDVIAYRQGLNAALIGQFSRFALWSQLGAALALRLTPESVYRGLEGGLTPRAMLDQLAKHSQRPLPPSVAEALRTWAGRRERVTYFASTTLVEFATPADLDEALKSWPASDRPAPVRVSDRLLLVEDEQSIPFVRFRMTGSRDYRRPPDVCVSVEPDGVTLSLDMARSDLLADSELARFADEQPSEINPLRERPADPKRKFLVQPSSLARAMEAGYTPSQLAATFLRRTGHEIPAAIKLMALAASGRVPLRTARPLVLHAPDPDVLDGLTQHPATRDYLGERLGPTSAVVNEASLLAFRQALARLGLELDLGTSGP